MLCLCYIILTLYEFFLVFFTYSYLSVVISKGRSESFGFILALQQRCFKEDMNNTQRRAVGLWSERLC